MSPPPRPSATRRPDAVRYLPFCAADPDFYEPLERVADGHSRFALADRPLPAGWQRWERGVWVGLRPSGDDLPDQGWKLHVSATLGRPRRPCGPSGTTASTTGSPSSSCAATT